MPAKQVIIEFVAKTNKLLAGMKKVDRKVTKTSSLFKKLGVTIAGALGARAVFQGFKQTLRAADTLIKTSRGVGFAVDEYRQLIFALDQVGVSAGSAKIALGDFQKRLAKAAAGTSPQFAKAFQQAGLDPIALSKLSPAEAFAVALKQLSTLRNDPTIAGLTGNVFEEQSGKDILQVLRDWQKFQGAREEYSRKVAKFTSDEERDLGALGDKVKLLTAQWDALKIKIVADVAPSTTAALEAMSSSEGFAAMTEGLGGVIEEFNRFIKTVTFAADALDKLDLPDWMKALFKPGGFSPQGVLSKAFRIEDVLPINGSPGDLGSLKRPDLTSSSSSSVNTTVTIKAARGSNEITDVEARRIKKAFDQVTRQAAQ